MMDINKLRAKVTYDTSTGNITDNITGKVLGGNTANGYKSIGLFGKRYLQHRIAWLLVTGSWPEHQIDHINGDRSDNRWVNLRQCTNALNNQNFKKLRCTNTSGHRNVFAHKGAWMVQLKLDGKAVYIGRFADKDEAIKEAARARKEMMPFCND